jgi:hypothetical protein
MPDRTIVGTTNVVEKSNAIEIPRASTVPIAKRRAAAVGNRIPGSIQRDAIKTVASTMAIINDRRSLSR